MDTSMSKIVYVTHDGTKHEVDVPNGQTVKDGAVSNLIPGILAECGGACACATCHVYVDEAWWGKTGNPGKVEAAMLDFANEVQETSRLSCQIEVRSELDGLIVHLPREQ